MATTRPSAFGDLLKRCRLAASLTHEQLAERSGLSARGISDLERGVRVRPHKDTILLLAEALALGPADWALLETVTRGNPASATEQSGSPAAAPLIGRDDEWKRMLGVWQTAVAGQPRLLVLSGEAGIGKTRLAEELLAWAKREGAVTAIARCYSAEGDLGYAPVIAWVRADSMRPGLERLDVEWLSEVARLAPDLVPQGVNVRQLGLMTEGWQRQRLFEALARAVLADPRPKLLLVDDLQWCGRDSLEWLHFLLRFNAHTRLVVLATVRVEEVLADHPLVELFNTLRHEGRLVEISLGPLSPEETTTLADSVSDRALDQFQATRLYAETEGNPLFIVETAQAYLAAATRGAEPERSQTTADTPFVDDVDLPPGIRAVVARRLSQVTPTAAALLGAAAVVGRSFTSAVLARAVGVGEDELVEALDELGDRRIVREHGPDSYDFTHDKLRAVAYAGLSPARRRMLHRRVAEALETEYVADLDPVSGQLALHYERAGLLTQAASFYLRSAAWARRIYANETAIASYRRALALVGALSPSETAQVHDQLGEMLHLVGRYDEACEEWQRAIDLTLAHERITRGHLFRKLGNARRDQHRYDDALATYDEAEVILGSVGAADTEAWWLGWAQIQLERIQTRYWLGDVSEILRLVDQVRTVFEKHGSASLRARLYQVTATALLRRDRYVIAPETRDNARAYFRAVEEAHDVNATPAAHFLWGFVALWADDLDEAETEISTSLTVSERNGDISLEGRCLTYLTVIARKQHQIERLRVLAERSLAVATAGHMPDYIGAAHGNLAWGAWRIGDYSAAFAHGHEALQAWRRLPAGYMFEWIGRWPLIGVALERGDMDEAMAHVRMLLDQRQQRPPTTIELELEACDRADSGGDVEAARTHLEAAAASARLQGYL